MDEVAKLDHFHVHPIVMYTFLIAAAQYLREEKFRVRLGSGVFSVVASGFVAEVIMVSSASCRAGA